METIVWWSAGGGSLNKEASWRPLYGGEQGGGSLEQRSFMETIVWWRAGGGSLNKEASWRPLSGGVQGGGEV